MKFLSSIFIALLLWLGWASVTTAQERPANTLPGSGGSGGTGGVVSNEVKTAVITTIYTNTTGHHVMGAARLGTSTAGLIQVSVTNANNTLYFQYQLMTSTAGASSNTINFAVPPGGWYKFIGLTTTATDGSQALTYYATNGSVTFATSAGSASTATTASGISGVVKIIHNGIASGDYTSITDALASAVAGDTVWAISGTFTNNNLLKAGVNIKGELGANILYIQTSTNDAGWGVFDDRPVGATTNIIEWPGDIVFIGFTNVLERDPDSEDLNVNAGTRGVIVQTNALSDLTFRGGKISGSKMSLAGEMAVINMKAGRSVITATEVTNRLHGLVYSIGLADFQSFIKGIKTENGNHNITVPLLSGELYAWEWQPTSDHLTNDVVIRSDMVKGICYGVAVNPENRGWFYAAEIDGSYSYAPGLVPVSGYGSGKWYFDVLKIKSRSDSSVIDTATANGTSNVLIWVTAQKLETANANFVNVRVGDVYVDAFDWVYTGSTMTQGIINSGNGRVFPFYSIGGKTNISASASSISIVFQKPLPSTNYSITLNHNFNPVASYYVSARNRTNCVVTYSTGVTTGGQIDYTATVQAQ